MELGKTSENKCILLDHRVCIICYHAIPDKPHKDVVESPTPKGLEKLLDIAKSMEDRVNDVLGPFREDIISLQLKVRFHKSCRAFYTKKVHIAESAQADLMSQCASETPTPSRTSARQSQPMFDIRAHCFICGNVRKVGNRKETLSSISLGTGESTRQKTLDAAIQRKDEVVESRLRLYKDLFAYDAKYHRSCYSRFIAKRNVSYVAKNQESIVESPSHEQAFLMLSLELKETVFSDLKTVVTLVELNRRYVELLHTVGVPAESANGYKAWRLKTRGPKWPYIAHLRTWMKVVMCDGLTLKKRSYHEMIHAYLFVTDNNKDHDGHGPEFHKHMYRINKATGTKITVYHTFHDEVALYKQHWWRCDGACRSRKPYFGYVKRSMNRAPSKNDTWFAEHQRTCGGTFTKVKEPEGYGKKAEKKKGESKDKPKAKDKEESKGKDSKSVAKNMDIRIFGGAGKTLGISKPSKGSDSNNKTDGKSKPGEMNSNGKHKPTSTVTSETIKDVSKVNIWDTHKKPTSMDYTPTPTLTSNTGIPTTAVSNSLPKSNDNQIMNKTDSASSVQKSSFHFSDFSDSEDEFLGSLSLDSPSKSVSNKTVSSETVNVNPSQNFTGQNLNHTIGDKANNVTDVRAKLRQIWGEKKVEPNKLLPLSCKTDFSIANSIPPTRKRGLPDIDNSEHSWKRRKRFNDDGDDPVPYVSGGRTYPKPSALSDISENTPLSSLLKRPRENTSLSDEQNSSSVKKAAGNHNPISVIDNVLPQSSRTKHLVKVTSPIEKMFDKIKTSHNIPPSSQSDNSFPEKRPSARAGDNVNGGGDRNPGVVVSDGHNSMCPVCKKMVPMQTINDHLDLCLTLSVL